LPMRVCPPLPKPHKSACRDKSPMNPPRDENGESTGKHTHRERERERERDGGGCVESAHEKETGTRRFWMRSDSNRAEPS